METLGQFLKREREFRRVSLEEVSRAIKNSVSLLENLEADRLEGLPKGIFLKGLLRSYCQTVGLNFEEMAPRFSEIFQPVKKEEKDENYARFSEKTSQTSQTFWIVAVVVIAIVLAAILASR